MMKRGSSESLSTNSSLVNFESLELGSGGREEVVFAELWDRIDKLEMGLPLRSIFSSCKGYLM